MQRHRPRHRYWLLVRRRRTRSAERVVRQGVPLAWTTEAAAMAAAEAIIDGDPTVRHVHLRRNDGMERLVLPDALPQLPASRRL